MAEDTPVEEAKEEEQEMQWKAEADCRTLIDAEEIKKDKPRLKRALAEAKKKAAALKELGANG